MAKTVNITDKIISQINKSLYEKKNSFLFFIKMLAVPKIKKLSTSINIAPRKTIKLLEL